MRILALGDPHGILPKNLDSIVKKNKIEAIIILGEVFPIKRDKKHQGQADLKSGEKVLNKICAYNIPTIIFKGNMFFGGEGAKYFRNLLKKYQKKYKKLYHKQLGKMRIKKTDFILFDMIYEKHSHPHLSKYWTDETTNNNRLRRVNKLLKANKNAILLTHAPPYGTLDKIKSGIHIGSKILLKAIKKNHPKLMLCGHVHEAKGKAKIGKTQIYNLGCCGNYKILKV